MQVGSRGGVGSGCERDDAIMFGSTLEVGWELSSRPSRI